VVIVPPIADEEALKTSTANKGAVKRAPLLLWGDRIAGPMVTTARKAAKLDGISREISACRMERIRLKAGSRTRVDRQLARLLQDRIPLAKGRGYAIRTRWPVPCIVDVKENSSDAIHMCMCPDVDVRTVGSGRSEKLSRRSSRLLERHCVQTVGDTNAEPVRLHSRRDIKPSDHRPADCVFFGPAGGRNGSPMAVANSSGRYVLASRGDWWRITADYRRGRVGSR